MPSILTSKVRASGDRHVLRKLESVSSMLRTDGSEAAGCQRELRKNRGSSDLLMTHSTTIRSTEWQRVP